MTGLFDIGAHLTHDVFERDRERVLDRAEQAGLATVLLKGASEEHSAAVVDLAASRPGFLLAAVGVHPLAVHRCDGNTLPRLRALVARPQTVAIGECGLDYARAEAEAPLQRSWFEAQLALAAEAQLPVLVHTRGARDDTLALLRDWREDLPAVALVGHDFDCARAALELDLYVSISHSDPRRSPAWLAEVPHDRLLLQTDAPFASEEPANLHQIVRTLAGRIRQEQGEVARRTTANARAFLQLPSVA